MFGKKGVNPFIAFIFVVMISISVTIIIIRTWDYNLNESQDYFILNEAKGTIKTMDSSIKEVVYEGEGSSRKISFTVSQGEYRISSVNNSIKFILHSEDNVFSKGTKKEGNFYIITKNNSLELKLNYTNIDIVSDERLSRGSYNFIVKNNGTSSGKSKLIFSLV